jgi:hypothetical protein
VLSLANGRSEAHAGQVEPEELLPEPPRAAPFRTARRRALVAIAAVLLIGGAFGAHFATSGSGKHTVAAPTASPTDLVTIGPLPSRDPERDPSLFPYDPTACPNDLPCNVSEVVPSVVLMAVRAYAPGAKALLSHTVGADLQGQSRGQLWYREFDAVQGNVKIEVVVQQAVPSPATAPTEANERFDAETVGFVRIMVSHYAISVRFTGPPDYQPPMAELRALAADPRLLRIM